MKVLGRGQSILRELELQGVVSHPMWVLGIEPQPFARVVHVLNHRAISLCASPPQPPFLHKHIYILCLLCFKIFLCSQAGLGFTEIHRPLPPECLGLKATMPGPKGFFPICGIKPRTFFFIF